MISQANSLRNDKGQFVKGHRHWREPKAYWDRDWLYHAYVVEQRSANEIASEFECKRNNILYWLHRHGIPVRTISQARAVKHWGLSGEANGMYGCTGEDNPNWRGGVTPERQALYCSEEWGKAVHQVWKRDEGACQRCGVQDADCYHIHHIVSFALVELRAEVSNLVLLCRSCHHFVHSRENTEQQFIEEGGLDAISS